MKPLVNDLEAWRRPVLRHCYRMLSSFHEAEDVTQETLLRGWEALDSAREQGDLKAWLLSIATRRCLDLLRKRRRRSGLGVDDAAMLAEEHFEPAPDSELFEPRGLDAATPEEVVDRRESVGLAFVLALQVLSPRQRASLLLMDVMGWSAQETAQLLNTTTASVNSLLQRARRVLSTVPAPASDVGEAAESQVEAFVRAWESGDVDLLASVLAEDAKLSMPPGQTITGRAAIVRFLAPFIEQAPQTYRLVRVSANGQPAVALYKRVAGTSRYEAFAITVLTARTGQLAAVSRFGQPGLFPRFGLDPVVAG